MRMITSKTIKDDKNKEINKNLVLPQKRKKMAKNKIINIKLTLS